MGQLQVRVRDRGGAVRPAIELRLPAAGRDEGRGDLAARQLAVLIELPALLPQVRVRSSLESVIRPASGWGQKSKT